MAGFNLFNTNVATPTTQSTSFGGSTPNTGNSFFGLNTSGISGTQPSTQNVSFGGLSTTGGTQNVTFGASPATGNISFGLPKTQNNPTFGTSPSTATGGLGSTPQNTFGAAGSQGGISFGTPPSQPSAGFGTSTTQPGVSFGAPTQQSGIGFGASTAQSGVGFGASAAQPTATFGSSGALPSFGSLKPQTSTGGTNLFANSSTSAPQTTTLLGSSIPTSNVNVVKPTFGGLNFAANTSTAQTGLSFGLQPSSGGTGVSQTANTTTQPNLFNLPTVGASASTAVTSAPTLSFGLSTTSQPSSFGTGAGSLTTNVSASQPTATQSGLGGLTFSPSTTAPSSFGGLGAASVPSSAATTTTGLLGTSFGGTTSNAGTGVFSWQKPTTEATAPTTTSVGLGGLDHTAVATAASTANTVVSAKEQMLPNEIQQTVASFKEYVKTQKNLSSEVARTSAEPLTKLTQQIGALNNLILTLGSILSQQKFTAEKIKLETIKSLNDYELAQKIKDSPVASEERMYAVRKYFIEKISAFEDGTKTLQEKIEYVYQHVITLPQENSLSAEALKLIVKKLHDSFVVIGARAYKLHNDMQLLKVQYLTLRNRYVKDNSSIDFSLNRELQLPFSEIRSKSNTTEFALEGPNPFSRTAGASFNSLLLTSQNRNFPQTTSSKDWNVTGFNCIKPFGLSDVTSNTGFDQNASLNASANQQFNLQKPPIGNKRGKR